jgi:hypothetical protein
LHTQGRQDRFRELTQGSQQRIYAKVRINAVLRNSVQLRRRTFDRRKTVKSHQLAIADTSAVDETPPFIFFQPIELILFALPVPNA